MLNVPLNMVSRCEIVFFSLKKLGGTFDKQRRPSPPNILKIMHIDVKIVKNKINVHAMLCTK